MGTGSITVELPADVIYVAGTVNGVETVFIQDTANPIRWRATAAVAEDNLYHIYLQMHDEAGNIGIYENILEYILPWFVYDRTQEDVEYVKELHSIGWENLSDIQKQEWLKGLKGSLNKSDLKRIENDIYVIAQLLGVELNTNKDNLPEFPDTLYFSQMLGNVRLLREKGYRFSTTPSVPELPINTWQKVNDIELILHDIYTVYNSNFIYYCGDEIYAGSGIGLL